MKIIHIEDFFHPNAGYQINILAKYMAEYGHDVTIISGELDKFPDYLKNFFGNVDIDEADKKYSDKTGVKIIRVPVRGYISGRAVLSCEINNIVKGISLDILYVHGNDTLTGIRCMFNFKKTGIPVVMDSHMLKMASKNPFSWLFKLWYRNFVAPIIIKNNIKVIRTQDDDYVERYLGIPLANCPWISIGTDTDIFYPDSEVRKSFRKEHDIPEDAFVIVYAGKLDESKGGMFLAQAIKEKLLTKRNVEIVFMIIGNLIGDYGQTVKQIFAQADNRIIRFPSQNYNDLPRFYQSADLSVFPKQCSLSFYDVQACGLPVLSENNNINISRLKFNNGFNFISGDIEDFRNKIIRCAEMSKSTYGEVEENSVKFIKRNYDYKTITKKYLEILADEYSHFKYNKNN